jgi:ABC-2 type transport system permease protein
MTGCLLGAAGLLTLYGLASDNGSAGLSVIEPFGIAAVADAIRGWGPAQREVMLPALGGALLANRLVWLAVAAALVGLGTWLAQPRAPRRGVRGSLLVGVGDGADPPHTAALPADARRTRSSLHSRSGWSIVGTQICVRTV